MNNKFALFLYWEYYPIKEGRENDQRMAGRTKEKTGGDVPPEQAVGKINRPADGGWKKEMQPQCPETRRAHTSGKGTGYAPAREQGVSGTLRELRRCGRIRNMRNKQTDKTSFEIRRLKQENIFSGNRSERRNMNRRGAENTEYFYAKSRRCEEDAGNFVSSVLRVKIDCPYGASPSAFSAPLL